MSQRRLTKQEALDLISSVVDEEADEEIKAAFFRYIENDSYVRRQYESARQMKSLVKKRCPVARAPEHLKDRIRAALETEKMCSSHTSRREPVYDIPCRKTPCSYSNEVLPDIQLPVSESRRRFSQPWLYVSMVALFITLLFWSVVFVGRSAPPSYSIEEYAYQHFTNHKGSYIQPTISAASMTSAEVVLESDFNLPITVPLLTNAEFKGVVFTDFVPDFKAPLLEYYLPDEEQYIYIFAFDINTLNKYGILNRNQEAVSTCVNPGDFHVEKFNDKYIVSWKWNSTWYAAISNQDGETLASLVQPLQYQAGNSQ